MYLTREEQLSVVSRVLEANNVSINEARSNNEIRERLKFNLEFYNSVKGSSGENSLNEGFLELMGDIKNYWTTAVETDGFLKVVNDKISKTISKYAPQVSKYIPQSVKNLGAAVKAFASWCYKTFGYKGFATFFAAIKYKTFRPTQDQINCLVPFAKIVIAVLYISLVALFLIKVIKLIAAGAAVSTAASAGGVQMAGIQGPITGLLTKVGQGNLAKGMFSALSAFIKNKRAEEYSDQVEDKLKAERQNTVVSLFKNFKPAWNACSSPKN